MSCIDDNLRYLHQLYHNTKIPIISFGDQVLDPANSIVIYSQHSKWKEITKSILLGRSDRYVHYHVCGDCFIGIYAYVKSHQIAHFKYLQCWGNKESYQEKGLYAPTLRTEKTLKMQSVKNMQVLHKTLQSLGSISHILYDNIEKRPMKT